MTEVIKCITLISIGYVVGILTMYWGFTYGLKIGAADKEDIDEITDKLKKYKEPAEFELIVGDKEKKHGV